MKPLALFAVFSALVFGQIKFTVSLADPSVARAYVDKTAKTVGIWQLAICSGGPSDVHLTGAEVIQAAAVDNIVLYDADAVDAVMSREQQTSRVRRISEGGEAAAILTSFLIASKVIQASSVWGIALTGAAGGLHFLASKVSNGKPDFAKIRSLAVPQLINFSQGGCFTGIVAGKNSVGKKSFSSLIIK